MKIPFLPLACAGALAALTWTASCTNSDSGAACGPVKADATTGATKAYTDGDRGTPPPAAEGYQVLGAKDGLKTWVVKYDDRLLRGGEFFNEKAGQTMASLGVKTVISVTPNDRERELCRKSGLALVEIPFGKEKGPSPEDLRRFIETVKTGKAPFYVHCVGGTHRGGVLGVAYRVHVLGWPYEKALVEYGRLGGDLKADHAMLETVRAYRPSDLGPKADPR